MTTQKIFTTDGRADITDIIFEHRNKTYGAYILRKNYNDRMNQSMLITLGIFVLFFLLTMLLISHQAKPLISSNLFKAPITLDHNFKLPANKPHTTPKTAASIPIIHKTNPDAHNYKIVPHLQTLPIFKPDSTLIIGQKNGDIKDLNNGDGTITTPASSSGVGGTSAAPDNNSVTKYAEVMPSFPGGEDALQAYLKNNLKYTPAAKNAHAEGQIFIRFIVNTDGTIQDVRIEHDNIGYGCAQNAIDVITNMPLWIPGKNNNHIVRVELVLPITYKLN